jgi:hypothetical protein
MEFGASQMKAEIRSSKVTRTPKEPGYSNVDLSRKGGWEGLSKSADAASKCLAIATVIRSDRKQKSEQLLYISKVSRVCDS